jgi:hypothetical protein
LKEVDEGFGGSTVGGDWDLAGITNTQQVSEVRLMGSGGNGISEENDCLHFVIFGKLPKLAVATGGAMFQEMNCETGTSLDVRTCAGSGDQVESAQGCAVLEDEIRQLFFLAVMSNKRKGKIVVQTTPLVPGGLRNYELRITNYAGRRILRPRLL